MLFLMIGLIIGIFLWNRTPRLESPADNGCAIINNGTLTVTDGSKKKTGRITRAAASSTSPAP